MARTPRKYESNPYYDGKKADENIKHCTNCLRCWEMACVGSSKYRLIYYDDYVTYGKKKVECPMCKKTNKIKNK